MNSVHRPRDLIVVHYPFSVFAAIFLLKGDLERMSVAKKYTATTVSSC